jgi:hypothetical protein
MSVKKEDREFVSGFFDGDGCVNISKNDGRGARPWPTLIFSQSRNCDVPDELIHVQSLYGGSIYVQRSEADTLRRSYQLNTTIDTVTTLLEDLEKSSIIKLSQIRRALDYIRSGRQDRTEVGRALQIDRKRLYEEAVVDPERITNAYVAGLFAAEGCVEFRIIPQDPPRARLSVGCCISKQQCPQILEALKTHYGRGSISCGAWWLRSKDATAFLEMIRPFLVGQKLPQVEQFLAYQTARPYHPLRKKETRKEAEEVAREIKRLKHT